MSRPYNSRLCKLIYTDFFEKSPKTLVPKRSSAPTRSRPNHLNVIGHAAPAKATIRKYLMALAT